MREIIDKTRELLADGSINLMIGYGRGIDGRSKPVFISNPESAEKLIFDDTCRHNLAVYLHKPEVKAFGKLGIVANVSALRSILQIAAENQLKDGELVVLCISQTGKLSVFTSFKDMEDYVTDNFPALVAKNVEKINELMAMSREERWAFWTNELSSCIKCYACRAACPMCYCSRCAVECNQPQWITVSPTLLGNYEWHMLRAMHLAGRCIGCDACVEACPLGIPINLLTQKLEQDVDVMFGQTPGMKATLDFAMSSFKVDDKENFIR